MLASCADARRHGQGFPPTSAEERRKEMVGLLSDRVASRGGPRRVAARPRRGAFGPGADQAQGARLRRHPARVGHLHRQQLLLLQQRHQRPCHAAAAVGGAAAALAQHAGRHRRLGLRLARRGVLDLPPERGRPLHHRRAERRHLQPPGAPVRRGGPDGFAASARCIRSCGASSTSTRSGTRRRSGGTGRGRCSSCPGPTSTSPR